VWEDSCTDRQFTTNFFHFASVRMSVCSPLRFSQYFRLSCCLHLQGLRISRATNQYEAGSKGKLAWLILNPEDGDDMFLWYIIWPSTDYMALHPTKPNFSNHCCESLKSCIMYDDLQLCSEACCTAMQVTSVEEVCSCYNWCCWVWWRKYARLQSSSI
jgi:hypothetical protein